MKLVEFMKMGLDNMNINDVIEIQDYINQVLNPDNLDQKVKNIVKKLAPPTLAQLIFVFKL